MSLLEELETKVNKIKEANLARLKKNYHYAKSLGFTPAEAQVLQGKNRGYIDRLHQERQAKQEG